MSVFHGIKPFPNTPLSPERGYVALHRNAGAGQCDQTFRIGQIRCCLLNQFFHDESEKDEFEVFLKLKDRVASHGKTLRMMVIFFKADVAFIDDGVHLLIRTFLIGVKKSHFSHTRFKSKFEYISIR